MGVHETVEDAYAGTDRRAEVMARDTAAEPIVFYVADEERRPVPRPGTH